MQDTTQVHISCCGLICSECPAFIATKNNDAALIEQTAKEWSAMYQAQVLPEDVWCQGCMTQDGRKSSHCANGCEIRKCALKKGFFSCSLCDERSGCSHIEFVAKEVPGSAALLDAFVLFRKQFGKKE